jgi:hypothetical protein
VRQGGWDREEREEVEEEEGMDPLVKPEDDEILGGG